MEKVIRAYCAKAAFVVYAFASPVSADTEMAARDAERSALIAGITCVYYHNSNTIKFEYERNGGLTAHVRTHVRRGSWSVEDDKFCIATPGTGKLQCIGLRPSAIRTKQAARDFLGAIDPSTTSKCYK